MCSTNRHWTRSFSGFSSRNLLGRQFLTMCRNLIFGYLNFICSFSGNYKTCICGVTFLALKNLENPKNKPHQIQNFETLCINITLGDRIFNFTNWGHIKSVIIPTQGISVKKFFYTSKPLLNLDRSCRPYPIYHYRFRLSVFSQSVPLVSYFKFVESINFRSVHGLGLA